MRSSTRRGLSLLELLVVLAILAAFIGLLLPAVQNVRLAALRTETSNRFRQVGLATHNYASAHAGRLPNVDGHEPNLGESVLSALLPYIEADTTMRTRRVDTSAALSYIPIYISPSDPSLTTVPETEGDTSLAVSVPVFSRKSNLNNTIPDGLANTIGFSEHYGRCNAVGFSWSLVSSTCQEDNRVVPCVNAPVHRATFADPMFSDYVPNPVATPSATFQARPAVKDCDYRQPQATHPNALITVMMDGHVRWFRPGVTPAAFWACVTPAGGEVTPD